MKTAFQLNKYEVLCVFEIANTALQDAAMFDFMAFQLDLNDKNMCELRDKIAKHMEQTKTELFPNTKKESKR
jgi:hypothetical protein